MFCIQYVVREIYPSLLLSLYSFGIFLSFQSMHSWVSRNYLFLVIARLIKPSNCIPNAQLLTDSIYEINKPVGLAEISDWLCKDDTCPLVSAG